MSTHRVVAAAVTMGLLLALAACTDAVEPVSTVATTTPAGSEATSPTSSSSAAPRRPPAADVVRGVRTSASSASSGTVRGTIRADDGRTLAIDLVGDAPGTNRRLRLTIPEVGTAEVLSVAGQFWLSGDRGFWTEQLVDPQAAAGVVGKYVEVTESDVSELGDFRLGGILSDAFARPEVAALQSATGPATPDRVDGRAAWVVGPAAGPRVWVAADGSDELLRYVGPKAAPADLSFTGWERAETFTAPPPGQVVEQ
jgi:hypothetical protein